MEPASWFCMSDRLAIFSSMPRLASWTETMSCPVFVGDIVDHVDAVEEIGEIAGSHDHLEIADVIALVGATKPLFQGSLALVQLGLIFIEASLFGQR